MLGFLDKIPYGPAWLKRTAFCICAFFLLYTVAGFLLLPAMVKPMVERELTKVLNGRQVTFESLSFNPLLLRTEVEQVHVAKKDGDGLLLKVDAIRSAASPSSLFQLAPVLSYLEIVNPRIELAFLGGGVYSIFDLLQDRADQTPDPESPKLEDTTLFPLVIHELMVENGEISLDDREQGQEHLISGLNLTVPFTSTLLDDRDHPIRPVLECVLNGDPIRLEGTTVPFGEDLRTEFHLGVVDLDVDRYWGYVPFSTRVKLDKGMFSSDLSLLVQRPKGSPVELLLQGNGTFRDVNMTGPDGKTIFGLKSIAFNLGQVRPLKGLVSFDSIVVDTPYLHLIRMPDGQLDLLTYLSGRQQAKAAPARSPARPAAQADLGEEPGGEAAVTDPARHSSANTSESPEQNKGQAVQMAENSAGSDASKEETAAAPQEASPADAQPALPADDATSPTADAKLTADDAKPSADDAKLGSGAKLAADNAELATGDAVLPTDDAGQPAAAPEPTGAQTRTGAGADGAGQKPQAPDSETPSAPAAFRLEIAKAELKAGRFDWEDRHVKGGFARSYGPLNLTASALGGDRRKVGFTVSVSADGGESYTAEGNVSLEDYSVDMQCSASGVSIPAYEAYFGDALPVDITKGVLAARTTLAVHGGAVTIGSTDVTLDGLDVVLADGESGLRLRHAALTGGEVDLEARTIQARSLSFAEPAVRLRLDENMQPPRVELSDHAASPDNEEAVGGLDAPSSDAQATKASGTATLGADASGTTGPAEQATAEERPMVVTLNTLKIEDASVLLKGGRTGGELLHVKGADLGAEGISTAPDARIRFNGVVPVPAGGKVLLVGDIVPDTLDGSLRVSMDEVSLSSFNAIAAQFANLRIDKGQADMEMELVLVPAQSGEEPPAVDVKGGVTLKGLQAFLAREQTELGSLELLDMQGISLSAEDGLLQVADVAIVSPVGRYVRDENGVTNFDRISLATEKELKEAAAGSVSGADEVGEESDSTTAADTPSASSAGDDGEDSLLRKILIGKARLESGHFALVDKTVSPAFILEAKHITGEVVRRKDASGEDFSIDAEVSGGNVHADGMFKLEPEHPVVKATATVKGMDLLPFTPFAVREVGYPVLRGRFNADVKLNVEGKTLNADNSFLLRQFELGDPVPGAKKPQGSVKFGLSLLRDSAGDISLNIPVSGKVGDPNLAVGGIIFKALSNVLVSALTSPFSLLGSIVGSLHSAELEYVAFAPGSMHLTEQGQKKLDDIAAALLKRPRIIVDIDGVANMEADAAGMADFLFMQELRNVKYASLPVSEQRKIKPWQVEIDPGEEYDDLLQEVFTRETGKGRKTRQIMEEDLKERIQVTPNDVERLAMLRARVVENYLIEKDPALKDRVFVMQQRNNKTLKKGLPPSRVDLSLR